MATLQDYLGITKLRDAWPKWKANVIAINNQVINHVAGTADKHSAQDIPYTGDFVGKTEVKAALDQAKTEIDTIVVNASIDPEVAFARDSAVKGETFDTLDARLEESEQDLVSYKAETTSNITTLQSEKMDKNTTGITVSQINKNLGKFDQTYMTDELLLQITGGASVSATPAPLSIVTPMFADKSTGIRTLSDYTHNNLAEVEKVIGSEVNLLIDSKDLTAIANVAARTNTTRILEAPATSAGLVTLVARFEGGGNLSVLIMEKDAETYFRTVRKQTFAVFAGDATIETDLIIDIGQYVGIYEDTPLYFLNTTGKQSYSYDGEIAGTFVATTGATIYDFSYYYKIGGRDNILAQVEIDTNTIKNELSLYDNVLSTVNTKDLSIFTSTASGDPAEGAFRVNGNPSPSNGKLKIHCNFAVDAEVEVYILERQVIDGIYFNRNYFKKVSTQLITVASGIGAYATDLVIKSGQYVALVSHSDLKYLSTTNVSSFNLAKVDITAYTLFTESVTLDYGFYYELEAIVTKIAEIENSIGSLTASIASNSIASKTYKDIGAIYTEKFIGTILPTPPFGAWLINGVGAVNDGVTLTPATDWSAYLQLTQRTHFDSDGTKYRIKLNDITSKVRVERRTAPSPLGFTSTAELDNGTLRIYKTETTASGIPTTVLTSKTVAFTLVAGREYNLTLENFAEVLTFTIADTVTGITDSLSFTSTSTDVNADAGRCWDYPRFYVYSGNVNILQFDYFSRLPRSPKSVITGDSILEADTIQNLVGGGYTNRWAGKLYTALNGDLVIMGTAGETSVGIVEKIPVINKALKEPEYALLSHMTNDSNFATWKTNTETLISAFVAMGSIPVICMMPMRAGHELFYDAVLDYVVKCPYKVIWFNRAMTVGGDGKTHDSQYYIADDLHWNVAGHARAFLQVQADLAEIFPLI